MASIKLDAILPKFLWNDIKSYLPILDAIKLIQSSNQFKSMFTENDWKDIFLNNRPYDIAIVKNVDETSPTFWHTCCETYVGCDTIKAMIESIGYQKYDRTFREWYGDGYNMVSFKNRINYGGDQTMLYKYGPADHFRVYIKNITLMWDGIDNTVDTIMLNETFGDISLEAAMMTDGRVDIKFNPNYKIEIIGSYYKGEQTTFKSTRQWMNIIIPQYFSISNIIFDNISLDLNSSFINYTMNFYYKKRSVIISNCIFNKHDLSFDYFEDVLITRCRFDNSRINLIRSKMSDYQFSKNKSAIVIQDNIFGNNKASCIVMAMYRSNSTLVVSDNKFICCHSLFSNFERFKPNSVKPVIFRNNYISDVQYLGFDRMTINLQANVFRHVTNLYRNIEFQPIGNMRVDYNNEFTDCDTITPLVEDRVDIDKCNSKSNCILC